MKSCRKCGSEVDQPKTLRGRKRELCDSCAPHRSWKSYQTPGNHYKSMYGITREQVAEKAKAQQNLCSICGVQPDKLYVDHDHSTGTVRALLCNQCNLGLGNFEDNSVRMYKAIQYLETHKPTMFSNGEGI